MSGRIPDGNFGMEHLRNSIKIDNISVNHLVIGS